MRRLTIVAGVILSIPGIILIVAILYAPFALIEEIYFRSCGLSIDHARNSALRSSLLSEDPGAAARLVHTGSDGSCAYDFEYSGPAGNFSFVVRSTWLHGVKLSYAERDADGP